MRVALAAPGVAPHQRGGVSAHTIGLAQALAEAGVEVEVFAPRPLGGLTALAQRREERPADAGCFAVTYVNASSEDHRTPEGERRLAEAFGAFLDRERPQVVHFEHLVGLGPEGVREAHRRGIPTVFVAHDWWALHDNRRLVLPDLSTFEPGDLEAEARGRLAAAAFAELDPALRARLVGPYPTLLRDELPAPTFQRLVELVHGPGVTARSARGAPDPDPARQARLSAEVELLRARQAAKRAALTAVDARFATSRALARRLSALVGRAFSFRAPGVERARIAAAPRQARPEGAFRVGFFGSIDKERGLHVLLEALAGLEGKVELAVHGDSADRAYVARCRRRAEALGATWHGAYGPEDLPQRLASVDAVVLPSLWSDSAPFVLREAYAAGLAVVASDTEALRESVLLASAEESGAPRPAGLLVPPGDVGALRAALRRIAEDEELRAELIANVRHLDGPLAKRVAQEAGEWLATYAQLVGAVLKRRTPPPLPAHLGAFAERVGALEALPTRELFDQVSRGLVRLGAAVGLDVSATELMTQAVGRGSRIRDERAADARAIEWLRSSLRELGDARSALETRTRWREDQLRELADRVAWFEQHIREREAELEVLRVERDDHGTVREVLEDERRRLREEVGRREEEQRELTLQLEEARGALRSLGEERDWLRDTLDRGTEELRWLREHIAGDIEDALTDREALEMHFERLCAEHESLKQHEEWLRQEVAGTFGVLLGESEAVAGGADFSRVIAEGRARVARLVSELAWRRGEMDAARRAATGLFTRVAGGELATRARSWAAAPTREPWSAAITAPASPAPPSGDHVVRPAPRGAPPALPERAASTKPNGSANPAPANGDRPAAARRGDGASASEVHP